MRLVLASTSPARLALLRAAGVEPEVVPSSVDEPATVAAEEERLGRRLDADETVLLLGRAKAEAVAAVHGAEDALVLGGDSAFAIDGHIHGKPGTPDRALVRFAADVTDAELAAYVASGEPLAVAGAFTIDSLGGPFIDRIEGDPSTVVGLSLPALRRLVRATGVEWTDLWSR